MSPRFITMKRPSSGGVQTEAITDDVRAVETDIPISDDASWNADPALSDTAVPSNILSEAEQG